MKTLSLVLFVVSSLTTTLMIRSTVSKAALATSLRLPLSLSKMPCPRCKGMSVVRGKLTKKEVHLRKKAKLDPTTSPPTTPPNRMQLCTACRGTGLIDNASPPFSPHLSHPPPPTPKSTDVIIVGAGIAGCALALSLQQRNIPCVLFERDAAFSERKQGYGLTLQQGSKGLEGLGFENVFNSSSSSSNSPPSSSSSSSSFGIHSRRHFVFDSKGSKVGEWGMEVWHNNEEKSTTSKKKHNCHIARQTLRQRLMSELLPNTVQYGMDFAGYESSDCISAKFFSSSPPPPPPPPPRL